MKKFTLITVYKTFSNSTYALSKLYYRTTMSKQTFQKHKLAVFLNTKVLKY